MGNGGQSVQCRDGDRKVTGFLAMLKGVDRLQEVGGAKTGRRTRSTKRRVCMGEMRQRKRLLLCGNWACLPNPPPRWTAYCQFQGPKTRKSGKAVKKSTVHPPLSNYFSFNREKGNLWVAVGGASFGKAKQRRKKPSAGCPAPLGSLGGRRATSKKCEALRKDLKGGLSEKRH